MILLNSATHGFDIISHVAPRSPSYKTAGGRKLQQNRTIYKNCETFLHQRESGLICMSAR